MPCFTHDTSLSSSLLSVSQAINAELEYGERCSYAEMGAHRPPKKVLHLLPPQQKNPYWKGLCSLLDDKAFNDVCEDLGFDDGLRRFGVSHLT